MNTIIDYTDTSREQYTDDWTPDKVIEAAKVELRKAYQSGAIDTAHNAVIRLKTLQVNARNEKLTDESFREVATGILDDLVNELEELSSDSE